MKLVIKYKEKYWKLLRLKLRLKTRLKAQSNIWGEWTSWFQKHQSFYNQTKAQIQ